MIVARDGTRLATDIYLPKRPARVPAVMARTPYGKASNIVWFPAIGRLVADSGMAFVAQDTRGHYDSDGMLAPFDEGSDGWDTLEWIVRQPWSNGTAAVFGESYVGFTAIQAAATGHPALRAAALRNTGTDIAGDWLRHQGVLRLEFVLRWAFAAWSGKDNLAPEVDWRLRPLRRIAREAALAVGPDRFPSVLDRWAVGDGQAQIMGAHDAGPSLIDRVRVPTHLSTGWWDLFVRGAIRDWTRLAGRPGDDHRLVVESSDHAGHDWGDGPTPDPLAGFDALAATMPVVLASELAFLRKHLLATGNFSPARVSWMLTHAGPRTSPTWPPPGASPLTLHLADGGRATRSPEGGSLSFRADRVPVTVRWRHDPSDPVPALEGESVAGWFRRPDERQTQVRDDVLTFTTEPFREPLDLAGPLIAELVVTSPHVGGQVMAKLCDVYPDGPARRIADGASLVDSRPDGAVTRVELGDSGYRVREGHRLRLEVAASAYPRYALHLGTLADPWTSTTARSTEMALGTGPAASCLHLTVSARTAP